MADGYVFLELREGQNPRGDTWKNYSFGCNARNATRLVHKFCAMLQICQTFIFFLTAIACRRKLFCDLINIKIDVPLELRYDFISGIQVWDFWLEWKFICWFGLFVCFDSTAKIYNGLWAQYPLMSTTDIDDHRFRLTTCGRFDSRSTIAIDGCFFVCLFLLLVYFS